MFLYEAIALWEMWTRCDMIDLPLCCELFQFVTVVLTTIVTDDRLWHALFSEDVLSQVDDSSTRDTSLYLLDKGVFGVVVRYYQVVALTNAAKISSRWTSSFSECPVLAYVWGTWFLLSSHPPTITVCRSVKAGSCCVSRRIVSSRDVEN